MRIILYHSPVACSMVPFIALDEAAANFEVRVVNVLAGEHMSADYLALNPKHKVPLLTVDDQVLTENVAINQWIAGQFPDAQLLPSGLDQFKAISIMAWCASGIHPSLTPNFLPQRYCDLPGSEENVRQCAQRILRENLGVAEVMLEGREWFFETFTIPDAYFFWCFRRAQQFNVDVSEFNSCRDHFNRVSLRPSVQRVLKFERQTLGR